mmetsp:Transcript_10/g.6  ORF Transcript_10/g.6 Transcript_10/m.6 type:complete len:111 (-) Transcript_10:483-815(-)
MVLEYAKYGSLQELIRYTKKFEEITAFAIFQQILVAVLRVHQRGVAHLDIKENNILICENPSNSFNPLTGFLPLQFKLADFGISVKFGDQKKRQIFGNCGTARYMAPEQF